MVIVLDAGALLALERNDKAMWTAIALATKRRDDVIASAAVIAQAWRGGPQQARLASALALTEVASFDKDAREVGELCGKTSTNDVCDAHVALVAARRGDVLYTSDPDDMQRLISAVRRGHPAIVSV